MAERNKEVKRAAAWALWFGLVMIVAVMVGAAAGLYLLVLIGVLAVVWRSLYRMIAPLRAVLARFLGRGRTHRRCPHCAASMEPNTVVCRSCGRGLPPVEGRLPQREG